MPLYQYQCSCGDRFEALGDYGEAQAQCPYCGRDGARRIPSVTAPHRVYAENPASPDNWRRHKEAFQEVRYEGRKAAIEAGEEHGMVSSALEPYAIRASRQRFQTPTGVGPHEGGER